MSVIITDEQAWFQMTMCSIVQTLAGGASALQPSKNQACISG
jgi:hypothetical protein